VSLSSSAVVVVAAAVVAAVVVVGHLHLYQFVFAAELIEETMMKMLGLLETLQSLRQIRMGMKAHQSGFGTSSKSSVPTRLLVPLPATLCLWKIG
jgi:hypothetical protein